MSQQHQAQLQEAYQLIKSGQRQAATRILLTVLKQDRDSADAWWLLANATSDPQKQQQALNQVLRVKPDHNAAQKLLDKVSTAAAMRSEPPPPAAPPAQPASPFGDADPWGSGAAPFASSSSSSRADDPFDDPFAASSTQTRGQTVEDDPFGDPCALPSTQTRGRAVEDDPFGDPFAAPSTQARGRAVDDPFGDPFAASSSSSRADDPFGDPFAVSTAPARGYDDPFAGERPMAATPMRAAPPKKKGTNPLVIVLAVVGIIAVIGCGLIAITAVAGVNLFTQAVQTAMPEGTFQAAMEELQLALTSMPEGTFPANLEGLQAVMTAFPEGEFPVDDNGIIGDIVQKGAIGFSSPIRAVLEDNGFTNHAYKFTGESGQQVLIDLTAMADDFDVRLTLLGPDGGIVAENDDIDFQNDNLNSRIVTRLPANGSYTIIVSDVGFGGGEYELILSRG